MGILFCNSETTFSRWLVVEVAVMHGRTWSCKEASMSHGIWFSVGKIYLMSKTWVHPMKHYRTYTSQTWGSGPASGNTLPTYGCSLLEFSHLRVLENAILSGFSFFISRSSIGDALKLLVNKSAAEVNKHDKSRKTPWTRGLSLSRISFWLKWTGLGEGWNALDQKGCGVSQRLWAFKHFSMISWKLKCVNKQSHNSQAFTWGEGNRNRPDLKVLQDYGNSMVQHHLLCVSPK